MNHKIKKILAMQWLNIPGCLNFAWRYLRGHYYRSEEKSRRIKLKYEESMPHYYVKDITRIIPEVLKKIGIKAIISDCDNTLCTPFDYEFIPGTEPKVRELIKAVDGRFRIVSNSIGTGFYRNEASELEEKLGLEVYRHFWKKPWGYKNAAAELGVKADEILVIGDRTNTDIVFGNLLGALTILVQPYTGKNDVVGVASLRRKEIKRLAEMIQEGIRATPHARYDPKLVENNLLYELPEFYPSTKW